MSLASLARLERDDISMKYHRAVKFTIVSIFDVHCETITKYLEPGYGGPLEGKDYAIESFVERGKLSIIKYRLNLQDWLEGKNIYHNSISDYISTLGFF